MGKDHASGNGLQYTRNSDFDGHAHILPSAFNDDHSAIIQVADALAEFFAFWHDLDMDIFYIGVGNLNGNGGIFLQAVEHFESAPAAVAPHGIGGIGNTL